MTVHWLTNDWLTHLFCTSQRNNECYIPYMMCIWPCWNAHKTAFPTTIIKIYIWSLHTFMLCLFANLLHKSTSTEALCLYLVWFIVIGWHIGLGAVVVWLGVDDTHRCGRHQIGWRCVRSKWKVRCGDTYVTWAHFTHLVIIIITNTHTILLTGDNPYVHGTKDWRHRTEPGESCWEEVGRLNATFR